MESQRAASDSFVVEDRRRASRGILSACLAAWIASSASAQDHAADAGPTAELSWTLRATEELRPLAEALRLQLRRQGTELALGPPPPTVEEAIGRGELALTLRDGHVWVGAGGREGATHHVSLPMSPEPTPESVRALALAVESLVDQVQNVSWQEPAPAAAAPRGEYVFLEYDDAPPPREAAKPTVFLKMLMGWSPTRDRILVGPGAGFGLCVGLHCVVLEGELPLLPDERRLADGRVLRHRALSASVRGQARVALPRHLTAAVGVGLVTRIGAASLVGGDRRTTSAFGARLSLELAWRVRGPFEILAEGGVDGMLAGQRGRYYLPSGQVEVLEDRWTPWVVLSLRLRPRASGERP